MCDTRSNAFEAAKKTAYTDEPWFTKYGSVSELFLHNEVISFAVEFHCHLQQGISLKVKHNSKLCCDRLTGMRWAFLFKNYTSEELPTKTKTFYLSPA